MKHLQKRLSSRIVIMIAILFPLVFSYSYCQAEEIRYPVPSYEGEELTKLREWEKEWVGKKIDHTNVDQVKTLLPETFYNMHKQPDEWGSNTFTVAPYKQMKPLQGQIEWTLKGEGAPSVDNEGLLRDYVSGTPFPDPKTGIEIMYNYECRGAWEERLQNMDRMYLYDHRTGEVRDFAAEIDVFQAAERHSIPPIPELPDNPRGIRMAVLAIYLVPHELKGVMYLDNQYTDRNKDWDGWLYIAPIRRVRRQDTTQRQDHRMGTDYCSDDQNGWFGKVSRNTYKLLKRQEVLMGRHDRIEDAAFVKGAMLWQNLPRERINAYVVEAVNEDPQYMYSKTIFWFDPETTFIMYADKYDRKGNLWKINDFCQAVYTTKDDQTYSEVCTQLHLDTQRKHATLAGGAFEDVSGMYDLSHYTPAELVRIGR